MRRMLFARNKDRDMFYLCRGRTPPKEVVITQSIIRPPWATQFPLSPFRSWFLVSVEGTDRVRVEEPGHWTEFRLDQLHHHQVGKSEGLPLFGTIQWRSWTNLNFGGDPCCEKGKSSRRFGHLGRCFSSCVHHRRAPQSKLSRWMWIRNFAWGIISLILSRRALLFPLSRRTRLG